MAHTSNQPPLPLDDQHAESIPVPGREPITFYDFDVESGSFRDDVVQGLKQTTKAIPSKYFYDERGLTLFKKITQLPAYYLTRSEINILQMHGQDISKRLGPGCLVIEYGAGDSTKAELLLEHLREPAGYVPVDISRKHLLESARGVAARYPDLRVAALCMDYTQLTRLPDVPHRRAVVYFPGSTVGNLKPEEVPASLASMAKMVGPDGCVLIGVDLKKDRQVIELAYNDPEGFTAAFNKNMLVRINRELGGTFDLEAFEHRAVYNETLGRIEMHLVSTTRQDVQVVNEPIRFQEGETIHTENSYKYGIDEFAELARDGGFAVEEVWTDPEELFSVQLLSTQVESGG